MTNVTPIRSTAGQFLPGRSGNPAGRPPGSRDRASVLGELIDADVSKQIVLKVVARALAGEWPALRACFTRLVAPVREAPVAFELPAVASPVDVAEAGSALIAAMAAGEITAGEAQKVMGLLTAQLKNLALAAAERDSAQASAALSASLAAAAAAAPVAPASGIAAREPVQAEAESPTAKPAPACIRLFRAEPRSLS